jgi:hypothetical protein
MRDDGDDDDNDDDDNDDDDDENDNEDKKVRRTWDEDVWRDMDNEGR